MRCIVHIELFRCTRNGALSHLYNVICELLLISHVFPFMIALLLYIILQDNEMMMKR